jgi:hypothetical protein
MVMCVRGTMDEARKNQFRAIAFQCYLGLLLLGAYLAIDSLVKGRANWILVALEVLGIALLVGYVIVRRSDRWQIAHALRLQEKVRTGLPGEAEKAIARLVERGDVFASLSLNTLVKDPGLWWGLREKVAAAIGEVPDPSGIRALQEVFNANDITFKSTVDDYSRGPYLRRSNDPVTDHKAEVGAFLAPLRKLARRFNDQDAIRFAEGIAAQCGRVMERAWGERRAEQEKMGW